MRGPLLRIGPLVTAAQPPVAATVTTRDDIDAYRILYEDIDGDAHLWRIIALLVLLGAGFAALNLTTRIVEAQRREIGIGMAFGGSLAAARAAPRCCSA
jgi:putative ABC transport system permease protein